MDTLKNALKGAFEVDNLEEKLQHIVFMMFNKFSTP
jgi:hypothetical protein